MINLSKLLKVVNKLFFVFFICFMICRLVTCYETMTLTNILIVLCILPLVMIPYLLDKLKIYHMDEFLLFFYYMFLLLSLIMGCVLKLYYKIWWFDLLSHFISGFVSSIVGFIILQKNNLIHNKYKWFGFVFILLFTISIAACWEYFEFVCDKIFKCDAQWVFSTGVNDTMTDMLIATFAGIISSSYYLFYLKKNKDGCYGKKYQKEK